MTEAPPSGRWRPWLLVACVFGLLRFHRLGEWSLWYDEAVTVADAWHGTGMANPLGYALVRLVADLLGGPDPAALRLPAAVAGWLCIPLTWWAFRTVAGDRRAAIAAFLMATSSWALYWSQNARFYTLAQGLGLLGTGVFLRALLRADDLRGRELWAVLGLALIGAGAAFHPTAALLGGALVLAAGLCGLEGASGQLARRAFMGGAIVAAACTPWALAAFGRFVVAKDTAGLGSALHLVKSTGFFLTPVVGLAALVGGLQAWRGDASSRLLVLLPLLGGLVTAWLAFFAASSAQYVFVLLPAFCLLAAWPAEGLRPAGRLTWGLLLAAPLATGSLLYFSVRHGERPRWEEAYRHAWEQRGPGDLLLGMQASVGEFYLAPGSTDLRRPTTVAWLDRTNTHTWTRWAQRDRPLWLVVRPEFLQLWEPSDRAAFEEFLRRECRLSRRFPVRMEARDLDVEVWHRP